MKKAKNQNLAFLLGPTWSGLQWPERDMQTKVDNKEFVENFKKQTMREGKWLTFLIIAFTV